MESLILSGSAVLKQKTSHLQISRISSEMKSPLPIPSLLFNSMKVNKTVPHNRPGVSHCSHRIHGCSNAPPRSRGPYLGNEIASSS